MNERTIQGISLKFRIRFEFLQNHRNFGPTIFCAEPPKHLVETRNSLLFVLNLDQMFRWFGTKNGWTKISVVWKKLESNPKFQRIPWFGRTLLYAGWPHCQALYEAYLYVLKGLFCLVLQVAVIAGNLDLADVIQRHKIDDVGKWNTIHTDRRSTAH